jgi:hypothetical protein
MAPLLPLGNCLSTCVCGPCERVWLQGEYLLWKMKANQFPPLLTVGPLEANGIVGAPGTATLGGAALDDTVHNGGRFTAGGWITEYQGFGLEANIFFLDSKRVAVDVPSPTTPNTELTRPYFNVLTSTPSSLLVAFPGSVTGTVTGTTNTMCSGSSRLWGSGLDFIVNLCCAPAYRLDLLLGYRYLYLSDTFTFTETQQFAQIFGGNFFNLIDNFSTSNLFNGGDFGLRLDWRLGRYAQLRLLGKVAIGASDETSNVRGATSVTNPVLANGLTTVEGGFLALPSNSGHFTCEQFAVVPEFGINLDVQLTSCLRAWIGYTFLYWSNVARTGEQVNIAINPLEVPAIAAGSLVAIPRQNSVSNTDFFAHGLTLGLELRY